MTYKDDIQFIHDHTPSKCEDKYTKADLEGICKHIGIPKSGTKNELCKYIKKWAKGQGYEQDEKQPEKPIIKQPLGEFEELLQLAIEGKRQFGSCDSISVVELRKILKKLGAKNIDYAKKDQLYYCKEANNIVPHLIKVPKAEEDFEDAPEEKAVNLTFDEKDCSVQLSKTTSSKRPKDIAYLYKNKEDYFINNFSYISKIEDKLKPECKAQVAKFVKDKCKYDVKGLQSILEDQETGKILDTSKNVEQQKMLTCFIRDIIDRTRNPKYDNTELIQIVTKEMSQYFDLKKIPTKSAFGYLFLMWFKADNKRLVNYPSFVLKFAQQDKYGDLVHELAVGYALNKVILSTPFFSYTYGGFYCGKSKDLMKGNLNCVDPSGDTNLTTMTIQQAIPGATFLEELFDYKKIENDKTKSNEALKVIKNVFLAVAHGLNVAQKDYRYMHFDLHGQNILMRKISTKKFTLKMDSSQSTISTKKGKILPYETSSYNIDLDLTYVPAIIDYGKNSMIVPVTKSDGTTSNYFLVPGDDHNDKAPYNIEDLSRDLTKFFVSGFDIWRYTSDVLINITDNLSKKSYLYGLLTDFYIHISEPLVARKDEVKSRALGICLNAIKKGNFKDFLAKYDDQESIAYAYSKDREAYMFTMSDWIKNCNEFKI